MKNIAKFLLPALFFVACSGEQNKKQEFTGVNSAAETAEESTAGMGAPQMILPKMHALNLAEIQAGQMGMDKGCSADVKAYGQMLVTEHTAMDQTVMAMATLMSVDLNNMQWTASEQQHVADQQADMARLTAMTDCSFDAEFLMAMKEAHQFALNVVMRAEIDATDHTELDTMLDDAIDHLQMHLEEANEAMPSDDNGAGQGQGQGQEQQQQEQQQQEQEQDKTAEPEKEQEQEQNKEQEQEQDKNQEQDQSGQDQNEGGQDQGGAGDQDGTGDQDDDAADV